MRHWYFKNMLKHWIFRHILKRNFVQHRRMMGSKAVTTWIRVLCILATFGATSYWIYKYMYFIDYMYYYIQICTASFKPWQLDCIKTIFKKLTFFSFLPKLLKFFVFLAGNYISLKLNCYSIQKLISFSIECFWVY